MSASSTSSTASTRTDSKRKKPDDWYREYQGKRWFFVGIKKGPNGILPCHATVVGGVSFPAATARPVSVDGSEHGVNQVLALSAPDAGSRVPLTSEQVQTVLKKVRNRKVRWAGKRAIVYDAAAQIPTASADGKSIVMGGYAHPESEGDEPLARYLVMAPFVRAADRNPERLPSIEDLAPETGSFQQPGANFVDEGWFDEGEE